jgi:ferredoxin
MPRIIAEPCIGRKEAACVAVCPVDAIHPTKDEGDYATTKHLFINPETCIDCGLCQEECPVHAIFPQEELPAKWEAYIAANATYYNK